MGEFDDWWFSLQQPSPTHTLSRIGPLCSSKQNIHTPSGIFEVSAALYYSQSPVGEVVSGGNAVTVPNLSQQLYT